MPQLRGRHRGTLQVAARVFDTAAGSPGLLREVDFPVTTMLCFQVTSPLALITDMTEAGQTCGINLIIAVPQQFSDGGAPDFLHVFLLKEDIFPDTVFNIEPATRDGDMNMWMLIELATVGVQGAEDTDFHALFAGLAEHGTGGRAEEVIEQGPVVVEKGPEDVGHGEGNMLPVAVGQDVLLCGNPLLCGFEAT